MKQETKKLIDTIVDASSHSDETKITLRDLLTRIYIDGQIDGLAKARAMINHETINVGDEDHNLEAVIPDPLFSNVNQVDELPF